MTPLLQLEAVALRQNRREVLRSVSFSVAAGELVAIDGGANSGKTTLVEIILGARNPSTGNVLFDGAAPRRHLGCEGGLQLAHTTFRPALGATVLDQVAAPRMAFVSARRAHAEAWETLRLVGATRLAEQRPVELHHDERVRIGIAQALIGRPRLLVLDEPLRGAEPAARDELIALLQLLRGRHGLTVVMTTATVKGLGGFRHENLEDGVLEQRPVSPDAGGDVVRLPWRDTGS